MYVSGFLKTAGVWTQVDLLFHWWLWWDGCVQQQLCGWPTEQQCGQQLQPSLQSQLGHCPCYFHRVYVVVYHFYKLYIVLFSTLEQSPCAHVACGSEWVTSCFTACFEYVHQSWVLTLTYTYSAVWSLHGWCHVKLLPSLRVLCTPYNHAPCHLMQSCM